MKPNHKKSLHRKLMTLLSKAGIHADMRHEMIHRFTGGRTTSSKDLTTGELAELINRLQGDYEDQLRRLRSEILAIATRTGIHDPKNWDKFNAFMIHRSIHHKPLNEYSLDELKELRRQFRAIERRYKQQKPAFRLKKWQLN